ncbi:winged helix-turn-helix domain-containing protein [Haloferax sp. DFSO60]|uniref:winged helix-turn-helix domain-containing protein n=1 Tax=Haloferax sp. DFSO60 TaxID=3388652 RepID=UPI00397CC192
MIQETAESDRTLTYLTSRVELFDQVQDWCDEAGLSSRKLPSFHSDCETAKGEHGTEWEQKVRNQYHSFGLLPKEIHREAECLFGEQLPCTREGNCGYLANQDYDPEEYDVLVGHYVHAHVPKNVDGRHVVFDEFPEGAFRSEYDAGTWKEAISSLLNQHDDIRFSYPKELRAVQQGSSDERDVLQWLEPLYGIVGRDARGAINSPAGGAHPRAPAMANALLAAEDVGNHWMHAQLLDGRPAVIDPSNEELTVLDRPDLDEAQGVLALDGTPTVEKWELLLGNDLHHQSLMSGSEKANFLRNELGIQVVQTTTAANHYSGRSGISLTEELDMVLFEAVSNREEVQPVLISTNSALEAYQEEGVAEYVSDCANYGGIKGSNEFSATRVGIVAGSPHYGDPYIKKWAALAKESASRKKDTDGVEQDFGPFGNQILQGMRESEVLQALLRFGRDGRGATVYVHTGAIPDWVELEEPVPDVRQWSDGMLEVIDAIKALPIPEWRTKELAEEVSISTRQVRTHLNSLEELGYVGHRTVGRGKTWFAKNIDQSGRGHVHFKTSNDSG